VGTARRTSPINVKNEIGRRIGHSIRRRKW
jgi:hypothetical protein